MSRTYTQIRQLTARETGLFWTSGTVDSSGSTTNILRDDALSVHGDNRLNGFHVLLTSGSPSFTELRVRRFFQSDGDAVFRPELSAAPDSLTYEILPFSGTDFLYAIQDAIHELFDRGWLSRHHWMRFMGGSPIYNADFSYWTSSSQLHGWTATTTTMTRIRSGDVGAASRELAISETSLKLGTAAGSLALDQPYVRFLRDMLGSTITFYCWVLTSAASNARLSLNNGSENYSSYHGGSGDWELLHVEVDTNETDTNLVPKLILDTTSDAYFNFPFIQGGANRRVGAAIREYPFPIQTMPRGPYAVTAGRIDIDEDKIASGRGLGTLRQLGRQRRMLSPRVLSHHDENATTEIGVFDFSEARVPPRDGHLLWLRGDGPLTVPSTALDTSNIEVNETESLLLAKVAAANLLKRHKTATAPAIQQAYNAKISELENDAAQLAQGAGRRRDVATYSLGW